MPIGSGRNPGFSITDRGSRDTISFKLPSEVRAQLEVHCAATGMTLSELVRSAVMAYAGTDPFLQIRAQAYEMARRMIAAIAAMELPDTYEEAVARGLIDS